MNSNLIMYLKKKKKDILRTILVLVTLVYLPMALRPFNGVPNFVNSLIKNGSKTDGIGGASYTEYELQEINYTQNSDIGIAVPEPEEYYVPPFLYLAYRIEKGNTIGELAETFGLNQGTLVSINSIKNSRAIIPGQILKIPNQDGIIHNVAKNESLHDIAKKYEVNSSNIITANELFSEQINAGSRVFVPNAKLDFAQLQEINGDLFIWPIRGRLTSGYGYRTNPINGMRSFHTGIDLSSPTGTPIRAAMSGRVIVAGYSDVFGNYVVVAHHSNYRTLYGHMNSTRTKSGVYVKTGEVIGYVGSTGQSTGSHLHFTVYKNGVTVNPLLLIN